MSMIQGEKETTIISFIGMERCDILHYIADAGIKQNKKVLVIDNSYSNDYYSSFATMEDGIFVEIGDLMVVKNIRFSENLYAKFDYVFVYHGRNLEKESYQCSDLRYVMTNYQPTQIQELHKIEFDHSLVHHMIFRDKVLKKITEDIVVDEIQITVGEIYVLPIDMKDYELYLMLSYNSFKKLAGCSQDMYQTILKMGTCIYGIDEKQMKKIMKK